MALDDEAGFDRRDPGVGRCGFDQSGVALEKRQPAPAIREGREKTRKVKPIKIQGTPRSAITRGMIQLDA